MHEHIARLQVKEAFQDALAQFMGVYGSGPSYKPEVLRPLQDIVAEIPPAGFTPEEGKAYFEAMDTSGGSDKRKRNQSLLSTDSDKPNPKASKEADIEVLQVTSGNNNNDENATQK